jgi:hypothetical protein
MLLLLLLPLYYSRSYERADKWTAVVVGACQFFLFYFIGKAERLLSTEFIALRAELLARRRINTTTTTTTTRKKLWKRIS